MIRMRHLVAAVLGLALVALPACSRLPKRAVTSAGAWTSVFADRFDADLTVRESTSSASSLSPQWWLESGGEIAISGGVASTYVGDAPEGYYRQRYALRNPVDTDGGAHPQNLFRLVTTPKFAGATREQAYFKVLDYHLSDSPQRYDPNGLLLFSRYQDSMDLYYAGLRVDGHAVIKKKSGGSYYTLFDKKVLPGRYDRSKDPFLLPKDTWIGIRSETTDEPDGSVRIALYADVGRTGRWTKLIEGVDAGVGGPPLRSAGHAGIRTDFMDVHIDDFSVARPKG